MDSALLLPKETEQPIRVIRRASFFGSNAVPERPKMIRRRGSTGRMLSQDDKDKSTSQPKCFVEEVVPEGCLVKTRTNKTASRSAVFAEEVALGECLAKKKINANSQQLLVGLLVGEVALEGCLAKKSVVIITIQYPEIVAGVPLLLDLACARHLHKMNWWTCFLAIVLTDRKPTGWRRTARAISSKICPTITKAHPKKFWWKCPKTWIKHTIANFNAKSFRRNHTNSTEIIPQPSALKSNNGWRDPILKSCWLWKNKFKITKIRFRSSKKQRPDRSYNSIS